MHPAAPISHSQLDSCRFSSEPISHQLRKFYALDCSKPAQRLPLSVFNINQIFNYCYFFHVTSETGVTFSKNRKSLKSYGTTSFSALHAEKLVVP